MACYKLVSLLYNSYRLFPGGKERLRRDADPSPPSSTVVNNEYSYTSTPPMGRTACTESQCLYKDALYLYLYLTYSIWTCFIHCSPTQSQPTGTTDRQVEKNPVLNSMEQSAS